VANPGSGGATPTQADKYPVRTQDVSVPPVILAPLSGSKGGVIASLLKSLNPGAVASAGKAHTDVSEALAQTAQNLIDHATVLSQSWSGQAAQNAMNQFRQLHDTAIKLAQASAQTGSVLQWLGGEILPWYKDYQFSDNIVQNITEGEAVDILTRLGNRLVMANDGLPDSVDKTQLPGPANYGTPGTTNGLPNPGVPGAGLPPGSGLPGGGLPGNGGAGGVNGGLPGSGQGGTVPGMPGTGTVPGAPGTGVPGSGTGAPPGVGSSVPGTTQTAGYTGPPPGLGSGNVPGLGAGVPKMPGLGGGPGLGGLAPIPPLGGLAGDGALGGPGAALSDGPGGLNAEKAAADEAAAMGAQDSAAAEGMAGMPMGGGGAGQGGEKERKREAWMNEDDEIWGLNEVSTVPPVIGAA